MSNISRCALLVATRRAGLFDLFDKYERRTLMQLSITWWRELSIWATLLGAFEGYPWSYTEIITNDDIALTLQQRPCTTIEKFHES